MTRHTTFWEKVDHSGACWTWQASKDRYGYGQLTYQGRHRMAHQVAYELSFGPIPEGLCVLHRCDNPSCVNPGHLVLGTHKDNTQDMLSKGRDGHGALKGSENRSAKLTESQIIEIRALAEHISHTEIARRYGVTGSLIGMIVARKIWRHV